MTDRADYRNFTKVNLACGTKRPEDFFNIDLYHAADLKADISKLDMITDGWFEYALASHILEHFPFSRIMPVLAEWRRIVKPGGMLEVRVPDMHWIAEAYLKGAIDYKSFSRRLYAYEGNGREHRWAWDEPYLREVLTEARFVDLKRIPMSGKAIDTLTLQGIKPKE